MGEGIPRKVLLIGLNESPSEKEGKYLATPFFAVFLKASMKVPPKRKGNLAPAPTLSVAGGLNESPSEKEGK